MANLTYIDDLVEERVRKMFLKLSEHGNPLVRAIGEIRHRRATYRSIFQEVIPEDAEDSDHQSADGDATSCVAQPAGRRNLPLVSYFPSGMAPISFRVPSSVVFSLTLPLSHSMSLLFHQCLYKAGT